MSGEMIENAVRSGKIDARKTAKRSSPRKKENEVNTANGVISKFVRCACGIPVLLNASALFPKWYNANAQCKYHAGITGHSIENCTTFTKMIERFTKMGIVRFDDPSKPNVTGNLLPNHSN
ncbi:hypothetical protein EPI10_032321 [Gossypium australe]|uniref:Uncharacterized protein n=1 Tax=Gossypium australe TaxID=47621 RepID=A0A5B6X343_9ROSI|nr:hypothetical protein EPI10_032321 [Gossypium australe]